MSKQQTIIHLRNKTLTLEIEDFGDSPINLEDLLQVDINNPIQDIVTFPVIFNRVSVFKAEIDDLVREAKLDIDIFEAQVREEYRKSLVKEQEDGKGKTKLKYPTKDEVDDALVRDKRYKIKHLHLNSVIKEAAVIDGLYWSAKSKDNKLNTVSLKIKPEDFETEILEGTINSVKIRAHKNNFVQR